MSARGLLVAWSVSMALAGCAGLETRRAAGDDVGLLPLGDNLAGEACHAQSTSIADDVVLGASRQLLVYCGDWEWPSARVFAVEATADRTEALAGEGGPWRSLIAERANCNTNRADSTIVGGFAATLFDCELNNGGWPYLALVTWIDGAAYLADGIPAALSVVEQLVTQVSGHGEPTSEPSPAVRYMIDRMNERARYGAADLAAYYRSMTLGQYYNSVQAFSKAERQYRNALRIHEQVLGAGNSETTDALMHVALEVSNREQIESAETLFAAVEVGLDSETNPGQYARFLGYYAIHAGNAGNLPLAAERAKQATDVRRRVALEKAVQFDSAASLQVDPGDVLTLEDTVVPNVETAHSLYIEATALQRMGRNADAELRVNEAKRILVSAPAAPPLWEPLFDELSSTVEASHGNLPVAVEVQQGAVEKLEARAPGERPTAVSHLELGRLLLAQGRVDEALVRYRAAVELARRRANYFRLEQLSPYFDALLDRARAVPSEREPLNAEFFAAAQLVQSPVAAEDIARTVARFAESDDQVGQLLGELQRREYARLETQQRYQVELARVLEPGHAERLDLLVDELEQLERDLDGLGLQVQAISPRYAQLIGVVDAGVGRLRAALHPREGLLQVLVGSERSYVAFVDAAGIEAYAAPLAAADIVRDIATVRADVLSRGIGVVGRPPQPPTDVTETMHKLYLALLGPIEERFSGVSHLLFVPTGPLLSLPPGLLVTEPPAARSGATTAPAQIAWLARRTTISVVPSVQSLVYLRTLSGRSAAPRSLVGFGGFEKRCTPEMEETALSLRFCQVPGDLRYCLLELPGTGREVQDVARSIAPDDGMLLLGPDFSEARIKSLPLDEYRVLYFASHAVLPDEIECLSEPSIATGAGQRGEEDGFLTSPEILELELNADLVVLSACNTGAPDRAGGESLAGLARAFFFAGARSLLVSHWGVDDAATADLMKNVFDSLARGDAITLAAALADAQRKMFDDSANDAWSDPYFWAAFTLVGDGAAGLVGLASPGVSLDDSGGVSDARGARVRVVQDGHETLYAASAPVPKTLHHRLRRADE